MVVRYIIFLSLILISKGLLLWNEKNRLLRKWKKAEAAIVINIHIPNEPGLFEPLIPAEDEAPTYYPVIQFKTADDETITRQLETAFHSPSTVGERIVIIYNPENPTDLITYPKTKLEIVPKAMVTMGLIGLTISLLEIFGIISIF